MHNRIDFEGMKEPSLNQSINQSSSDWIDVPGGQSLPKLGENGSVERTSKLFEKCIFVWTTKISDTKQQKIYNSNNIVITNEPIENTVHPIFP
mmetsp:Transcript_19680/g.54951  ORF Transcript_19680/g.54951 Transcript_19680/m.54951 type:complete len:93 (-) Transcript_19680:849-1127(-)